MDSCCVGAYAFLKKSRGFRWPHFWRRLGIHGTTIDRASDLD